MGLDERDLLRQPAKLYLEGSLFLLVCLVENLFLKKKKRWINSVKEIYFSISRKIYTH